MKHKITVIITLLILFLNNNLYGFNSKIIVKVEDEIITNYDLKNKILITLMLANQEINQQNIDELKKAVLDQLINLKLKKIELLKYKIKKDEGRINSYLKSISGNNIQNFKNKFFENNLDFELFLDEVDTEIRWQQLIYTLYGKKIDINEATIDVEVEKIIKERSNVEEFELYEIEINSNLDVPEKQIIEDILKKINTIGFENSALNFSTSTTSSQKGYLGWINGKTLSKEIYLILSKMKIGEVSKPIKKQNNILFLKLNNKRAIKPEQLEIKKLKSDIIEKKKAGLFNLYSQSRLSKLKNNSFIQY
jgi:peptidyl-prolyl cis-trans isomerase SurA